MVNDGLCACLLVTLSFETGIPPLGFPTPSSSLGFIVYIIGVSIDLCFIIMYRCISSVLMVQRPFQGSANAAAKALHRSPRTHGRPNVDSP